MLVELTMRRVPGGIPINSPVDGIRIMALLPRGWEKDLRQSIGEIVIRVNTDEELTDVDIRARVAEILTNPEVSGWRVVACHTLATGPREMEEHL